MITSSIVSPKLLAPGTCESTGSNRPVLAS
jgi:hypothetical protein